MSEYYCVKCKAKREMKDAERVTMKNGKPALKGKCAVCGTTINTILSADKKEGTNGWEHPRGRVPAGVPIRLYLLFYPR